VAGTYWLTVLPETSKFEAGITDAMRGIERGATITPTIDIGKSVTAAKREITDAFTEVGREAGQRASRGLEEGFGRLDNVVGQAKDAGDKMGDALTGGITKAQTSVTDFTQTAKDAFSQLDPVTQQMFKDLEPALRGAADEAARMVGSKIGDWAGGLVDKVPGLRTGLETIRDLGHEMEEATGVGTKLEEIFDKIEAGAGFSDLREDFKVIADEAARFVGSKIGDTISDLIADVPLLGPAVDVIREMATEGGNFFDALERGAGMQDILKGLAEDAKAFAQTHLGDVVGNLLEKIPGMEGAREAFKNLNADIDAILKLDFGSKLSDMIGQVKTGDIDGLRTSFKNLWGDVKQLAETDAGKFVQSLMDKIPGMGEVKGAAGDMFKAFDAGMDAFKTLKDVGGQLTGVISGLSQAFPLLGSVTAPPIGLIITAVGVAAAALHTFFTKT